MQPLNTHLRDVDGHDRLAFHPACPICRQSRLTGYLDDLAVPSPRTRALLAAGVLAAAASATAPTGLAAEPDHEHEGAAAITHGQPADSAASRDLDPGGQATSLPDTAGPPTTDEPGDTVAAAPATDDDDPVVDTGDGMQVLPAPPLTTRGDSTPPPGPPAGSSAPVAQPDSDEPAPAPDADPSTASDAAPAGPAQTAPTTEQIARPSRTRRPHRDTRARARSGPKPGRAVVPAAVASAPSVVRAVPTGGTTPSSVEGRRARPGDRWHTVLAGESLWSISSDALGGEATIARVAREVHELWKLNSERIATGDPDLILVGTVLKLR